MKNQQPKRYKMAQEKIVFALGAIPRAGVPEIKIRYNKSHKVFLAKLSDSFAAAEFIRKTYTRGSIELQESFVVLYCNQKHEITGYYKHSIGGITSTLADIRLIMATALKSASVAMLIAHNHPSGNLNPSKQDETLTKRIDDACKLMEIKLLDHIIVTKKEHFSFAENHLLK